MVLFLIIKMIQYFCIHTIMYDEAIKIILTATILEIIGIFGVFFVFGALLSYLQKRIHTLYQQTIGWKAILWTAWIGTPIHECSHLIMAWIFRHSIGEVALFRPNEETGSLGYVEYGYNKWNIWQRIGTFFVGAAPMILGSLFLFLMYSVLLPHGDAGIFPDITIQDGTFTIITTTIIHITTTIFNRELLTSWHFWLFLYMSFCIASHIAPSKKDRIAMWHGLSILVLILIAINTIAYITKIDLSDEIRSLSRYLGFFVAIFTYATAISCLHYLMASLILSPLKK